jgi:tetratricopeptide (TPR) repeat protein
MAAKGRAANAMADLTQAIRLAPNTAAFHLDRADEFYQRGEVDSALADYGTALRIDPSNAAAYGNRGAAYAAKREWERALADFETAIRLNPRSATAYLNRSTVHEARGDLDAALADASEAVKLGPERADVYANRAAVLRAKGDLAKASADLRVVVKLDPNDLSSLHLLGWWLATHPDPAVRNGRDALAYATRAVEKTRGLDSAALFALAAAQAELGQFDEAVASQKKGLGFEGLSNDALAAAVAALKRYEAKQPVRTDPKGQVAAVPPVSATGGR